jgi:hypothetical protein
VLIPRLFPVTSNRGRINLTENLRSVVLLYSSLSYAWLIEDLTYGRKSGLITPRREPPFQQDVAVRRINAILEDATGGFLWRATMARVPK